MRAVVQKKSFVRLLLVTKKMGFTKSAKATQPSHQPPFLGGEPPPPKWGKLKRGKPVTEYPQLKHKTVGHIGSWVILPTAGSRLAFFVRTVYFVSQFLPCAFKIGQRKTCITKVYIKSARDRKLGFRPEESTGGVFFCGGQSKTAADVLNVIKAANGSKCTEVDPGVHGGWIQRSGRRHPTVTIQNNTQR